MCFPPESTSGFSSVLLVPEAPCVWICRVLVTTAPLFGMSVVGLKAQVEVEGCPEQESVTISEKPFSGAMEMVIVPNCPGDTVTEAGFAVTEKSGRAEVASAWAWTEADDDAKV